MMRLTFHQARIIHFFLMRKTQHFFCVCSALRSDVDTAEHPRNLLDFFRVD
jgi:thiosulfate reductase cytochrome b subunit